jgi:phage terminase small subunit
VPGRKTPLRPVQPGETAPKRPPRTVTQAASGGSTRELLVSMRDRVAKDVENENTPARDLAALTKRLMEIVRDIEAIDARAHEEAKESAATADEAWDSEAL